MIELRHIEVEFLRGTDIQNGPHYNKGEIADFDEEMAKKLMERGDARFVREYEKKHDALSEAGLGHWRMQEEQFGARQERQDAANKATISGYKYIKIGAIATIVVIVVTVVLAVLFHLIA